MAADHPTEQVDRVAEAIWNVVADEPMRRMHPWSDLSERLRDKYRRMACAALDAATPQVPPGQCTERLESHGSVYFCDLLHGHTGMHTSSGGPSWWVGSVGERDQ